MRDYPTQRENPATLSSLWAEKCFNRSTFVLNCDSPEDLPHFSDMWACQWCIFFSERSASLTPSAAKLMEKKTSKHERNDAKTRGCVCVIYGDESAFGVKMHVDALHTVPTPCSPSTNTHTHICTQKHTHMLYYYDIIGEGEGCEGAGGHDAKALVCSHDMYKHITQELLLTVWDTQWQVIKLSYIHLLIHPVGKSEYTSNLNWTDNIANLCKITHQIMKLMFKAIKCVPLLCIYMHNI